jgi:hypothetical protein
VHLRASPRMGHLQPIDLGEYVQRRDPHLVASVRRAAHCVRQRPTGQRSGRLI